MRDSHRRRFWLWLVLGCLWAWLPDPATALAQVAPPVPAPAEKKEEAPTTCGPLISDTCIPIEAHHLTMQLTGAYSIYQSNFSPNWRRVSLGGDFSTFYMPFKITYGPTKNLETYLIVPFIANFASSVSPDFNGSTSSSYSGIGDISWFFKYLLLEETAARPAVTGVLGMGFPSGHASHLNPRFFGTDAVGTGAFTFTTGFNFYKYIKPFVVYSNLWLSSPVNIYEDNASHNNVRSREYVTFNLAAEYPLSKRFVILLEAYSTWTWTNMTSQGVPIPQGYQSPYTKMGILTGLEFLATDKWSVAAGCAFDLYGKGPSSAPAWFTPMVTTIYSF
jgi:hypothetical protein